MPLNFNYELDFTTFERFAKNNAVFAFMQALAATHNSHKAEKLAVNALFTVLKNKKHFEAEKNPITERTAVELSLRSLLSSKQKDTLDFTLSSDGKPKSAANTSPEEEKKTSRLFAKKSAENEDSEPFTVYPPSEEVEHRIVSKACAKAESITPRFAPLYTGTKSGLILLVVLAFICGAIFFIWSDPTDLLTDKSTAYDSSGSAVFIPGSNSLIDVDFVPVEASNGCVPIQIHISGPDSNLVSSVTYSAENSSIISNAYQCGSEYWVMMANSDSYYKVNIKGTGGLDFVKHFRVSDAIPSAPSIDIVSTESYDTYSAVTVSVKTTDGTSSVSSADILNYTTSDDGNYIINVPNGSSKTMHFIDSEGRQSSLLITGSGEAVVSPVMSVNELSMGHDSTRTFPLAGSLPAGRNCSVSVLSESENIAAAVDSDNNLILTASNGFVGVDSVDLCISDDYGLTSEISVPVIVVNSAPFCPDPTQLYATVLHTPTNTGYLFGTLSATDAQGDKLSYTVTNQTDCKVTLSPSGNFMLFIDADYRGHSVSFDFSVSDGLLTSENYRYTVSLYNNIPESDDYSQEFVCYAGENGWYTINLPSTDADGDILNWTVTSSLTEDGRTPEGNYISFTNGLSTVLLRVNPERNERFSETITLTCSDGWISSDTITLKCKFVKNNPPVAGKNISVIDINEMSGTFTLDIKDDCEFDRSAITGVVSCSEGEVVPNVGWNTLTFTVNFTSVSSPDLITGTNVNVTHPVTVVLTVEDIVTKETIEVEYTITRETAD